MIKLCVYVKTWYTGQIKMVNDWLTERSSMPLHPYQLNCLMSIVRVIDKQTHLYFILTVFDQILNRSIVRSEEAFCLVLQTLFCLLCLCELAEMLLGL